VRLANAEGFLVREVAGDRVGARAAFHAKVAEFAAAAVPFQVAGVARSWKAHLEARIRVLLEEAEKILALDEVDLAGVDGLGSQFVGLPVNGGAEAQNFPRFGNLQDERLAIGRADGELYASLCGGRKCARSLAPDKRDRPLGTGGGILDRFEGLQAPSWVGHGKMRSACTLRAGQVSIDSQSAWSEQGLPPHEASRNGPASEPQGSSQAMRLKDLRACPPARRM